MPKMSKERQGEIALVVVKKIMAKHGLKGDYFRRDLGNEAKELGIPVEELSEFYITLLPEMLSSMLGVDHVGLTIGEAKY